MRGRPTRISPETREAIIADIKHGLSISAVARKYKVGAATVQRIKNAAGITIDSHRPQKLSAEIYQKMLELRSQGFSYASIAEQVGFSHSATHRILTRQNPPNFAYVNADADEDCGNACQKIEELPESTRSQILALRGQMSAKDIAAKLGISTADVYRTFALADIEADEEADTEAEADEEESDEEFEEVDIEEYEPASDEEDSDEAEEDDDSDEEPGDIEEDDIEEDSEEDSEEEVEEDSEVVVADFTKVMADFGSLLQSVAKIMDKLSKMRSE